MTALPINPTYVDLYDTYANAYTNATEEQLASELHDGDRHSVAKLAVFQAGVEAERARAAAEATVPKQMTPRRNVCGIADCVTDHHEEGDVRFGPYHRTASGEVAS